MPHIHEKYDFVVTIYIVHKNRVLLVKHSRYDLWLPIGGHVELDEHPEEALKREIIEETGIKDAKILAQKPDVKSPGTEFIYSPNLVEVHDANPPHRHIGLVYFAQSDSSEITISSEHEDFKWFSKAELKDQNYGLSEPVKYCSQQALRAAS